MTILPRLYQRRWELIDFFLSLRAGDEPQPASLYLGRPLLTPDCQRLCQVRTRVEGQILLVL